MSTSWSLRHLRLALVLGFGLGCGSRNADTNEPELVDSSNNEASAASFENSGGMWMPSQMAAHADTLRKLGLSFDPSALTDPTARPLGAVVSLGGCSASFVSAEGLIITNHHCVTGALQYNSTPDQNLLENGWLARSRTDEKWAGPTARVYVTTGFTDVTDQVLSGVEAIADAKARHDEIEKRTKQLTASCEQGRSDMRCRIASYFEGAQFFQIEQLEIRDVRLVYAPDAGIGVFGGEIDNWRWPRHTGDYSFLRAYVGKDGKPADHSPDNVAYHPPHHLEIAREPLRPGDMVMVAGYPGTTYRLKTADEVEEATKWHYPRRIEMYQEYISVLEKAGEERPEVAIKAASRLRGLNNYLTNYKGMLDGLVQGGLAAKKTALEADLQQWIDADPQRKARWGSVLADMRVVRNDERNNRDRDTAIQEVVRGSSLLQAAMTIVAMAEQRQKPDPEREPEYQERNWARQKQSMAAMQRSFDAGMDRAVLRLFLARALRLADGQRPDDVLAVIVGDKVIDDAKIDAALDRLYKKTKLGDEKTRIKLLETATPKQLRSNRDPFIVAAIALKPIIDEMEQRAERTSGALAALRPKYIAALREFVDGPLSPDANGTLRLTFGTVRGYRPKPDADVYFPFTTVSEMVAKHTGTEPFDAPDALRAAVEKGDFGSYRDEVARDLPLDFLADLDITGGNSGSATLDRNGNLVGLVFDGNYESIASDWVFIPEVTRSIHVDIRYVLWIMDAVDGADHLLEEMGVQPRLETVKPTAK